MKKYEVTITKGYIQPRGGIKGPFTRTFTVFAKSPKGAVIVVRDAGYSADKVEVREVSKNLVMTKDIADRFAEVTCFADEVLSRKKLTKRERERAVKRYRHMVALTGIDPFYVTEERREELWKKGLVI